MCSVKVMRLQSSATGGSLLPALAARHAHLVRQAGEDARPLGHERRAHLHRARALGERPRDVVAGLDAADRDQLEARARLQAELLEAGEAVAPAMLATTGQRAWAASSRTSGRSLS